MSYKAARLQTPVFSGVGLTGLPLRERRGKKGPKGCRMNFASDNAAGVAPQIMEAIMIAARASAPAYGADDWTARARASLDRVFEREVAAFFVATGTGANALALGAVTPAWGGIFCHEESHIQDDECGAPEMFTGGAKLVGMPGEAGKISAATLRETLARYPAGLVKSVQPAALSLSQASEAGTIYSPEEIGALSALAHEAGCVVHIDGARFANAIVAAGCSPADMTWRAGVDALSLGATKNGALACEAVIFFDPARAANFEFQRKRAGHTLSKARLLGAQMEAWLAGGLWLDLARQANLAARRLAGGLSDCAGVRLVWPTKVNEVFATLPASALAPLRRAGARFYEWSSRAAPAGAGPRPDEAFIRLVCSFETSDSEVDEFVSRVRAHRASARPDA
jgi:threonine aldolase